MGLFSAQHEPAVQFGTVCPVSRYNYAIAFKEKNFLGGGEWGGGGGERLKTNLRCYLIASLLDSYHRIILTTWHFF